MVLFFSNQTKTRLSLGKKESMLRVCEICLLSRCRSAFLILGNHPSNGGTLLLPLFCRQEHSHSLHTHSLGLISLNFIRKRVTASRSKHWRLLNELCFTSDKQVTLGSDMGKGRRRADPLTQSDFDGSVAKCFHRSLPLAGL